MEHEHTNHTLLNSTQARTQGGVGGVVRHPLKQPREFERYLLDVHFLEYCTCQQKDVQ